MFLDLSLPKNQHQTSPSYGTGQKCPIGTIQLLLRTLGTILWQVLIQEVVYTRLTNLVLLLDYTTADWE